MSQRDERAVWLALLFGGQLKRQTAKAALFRWCVQGNRPLAELLALSADEVRAALDLDASQARALLAVAQDAPAWAERVGSMAARSMELVLRVDAAYPDALIQRLPEAQLPYVFFARGDLALLSEPEVSLQGSGEPSLGARQAAEDLARALAQQGQPLVGGYDQGVDRLALDAARRAGGAGVLVLSQGLESSSPTIAGLEADIAAGRLLVLSPYLPEQTHSVALAQARLPLITALSEALFLFEPEVGPRDWPGYATVRAHGLQTFLWACPGAIADGWLADGAATFGDADSACRQLSESLGLDAAPAQANTLREPEPDTTLYQSPHYADADAAIDALRRSGAVPPALARRLRQAEWSDEA